MGKPSSGRLTAMSPNSKPLDVVARPPGIQVFFIAVYQVFSLAESEPW